MTLASPFAAISAYLLLGERMSPVAIIGMLVTLLGIGISIMGRADERNKKVTFNLPMHGILLGIGGALGQGLGLVLSKHGMLLWDATGASVPVAATMIRGIMGLAGFSITLLPLCTGRCMQRQMLG